MDEQVDEVQVQGHGTHDSALAIVITRPQHFTDLLGIVSCQTQEYHNGDHADCGVEYGTAQENIDDHGHDDANQCPEQQLTPGRQILLGEVSVEGHGAEQATGEQEGREQAEPRVNVRQYGHTQPHHRAECDEEQLQGRAAELGQTEGHREDEGQGREQNHPLQRRAEDGGHGGGGLGRHERNECGEEQAEAHVAVDLAHRRVQRSDAITGRVCKQV